LATRKAALNSTFGSFALKRSSVLIIGGLLLIFLVAAAIMYQWTYAQRVYVGVRSANIGMGGFRKDLVSISIQTWYAGYEWA
jgi:hypothetical protein